MPMLRSAPSRAVLLFGCLATATRAGCAQQTALLNQPLAWTPTKTLDLGVTTNSGTPARVRFQTFSDTAPDPTVVGENIEQAAARQVTTRDPVGPFVTQHLQALFAQAGYSSGGAEADRVISGEVEKFFVKERNDYRGNIVLVVTVSDRSGKVLWQGTAYGTNSTFGRSYHLDNYQQVLSDSLVDVADNLLKNPALRGALTLGN